MKKMKKLLVALLTIALTLSLVACNSDQTNGESSADSEVTDPSQVPSEYSDVTGWKPTYVIGSHQPLSGSGAPYGQGILNGMKVAVAEQNDAGGILGAKIEIIEYDDANNTETAVQCVTRLVKEDKVDAIQASCTSGSILAAGPIYEEGKVITMAGGNAVSVMDQGWRYVYRTTANNDCAATSLIDVCEQLGIQEVYIFHGAYENGTAGVESFENALSESGANVTIIGKESYENGDVDYSGQCNKIAAAEPDAVFTVANSQDLGSFAKQLRAAGYEGHVLGTVNWVSNDVLEVAGSAADGVICASCELLYESPEECTDPAMKAFCEKYLEMFGEMPANDQPYRGYDGAKILFEAIERCRSFDSTDIRNEIDKMNDYVGLQSKGNNADGTYDFTISKDGEGLQQVACWVIDNGKFVAFDEYFS